MNFLLIARKNNGNFLLATGRLQKIMTLALSLIWTYSIKIKQQKEKTSCYYCEGQQINNLRVIKRRKNS